MEGEAVGKWEMDGCRGEEIAMRGGREVKKLKVGQRTAYQRI